MAPADSSALKYRALLEISEAFIACRDYATLLRTLWDSLRGVIPFDYLALVRYDQQKRSGWLEAFAGYDGDPGVPLRTDLPLEDSPIEILLTTGEPLYVPDIRRGTRFRADIMERFERYRILSGYWVPLARERGSLGCLSFASQSVDAYGQEDRELMDHIARHVTIAVENAIAFEKISELRKKFEEEKLYLEEEIRAEYRFDEIVGNSPAIRAVLKQIQTASAHRFDGADSRRNRDGERIGGARDSPVQRTAPGYVRESSIARRSLPGLLESAAAGA